MGRHGVRSVFLLLTFVFTASAQHPAERPPRSVRVDIQVYLPGGEKPSQPIPLQVRSDDWRVNESLFTTSDGWATVVLEENTYASIMVAAEEGVYATTSVRFSPAEGRLAIHLKPYPGMTGVVSLASLHKPNPKARKLYEKGLNNLKKSRPEEAEKQLLEAAALDPLYTAPVIRMGRLRLVQHRFEDAEEFFRQALELDARSAPALTGLGIALGARGDYRAALDPLEEAARLSNDTEAQFHLGVTLMENGRLREAERALRPVAESDGPLAASSHFALGRLYGQRGDSQRGITSFESFLALRPQGEAADVARQSIRALRLLPQKP